MNKLKLGISLIILGNLLYVIDISVIGNKTGNVIDFLRGLFLGLSVGVNIIGIILVVMYVSKLPDTK